MNETTMDQSTSAAIRDLLVTQVAVSKSARTRRFWGKKASMATLVTLVAVSLFGGAGVALGITAIQPILMPSRTSNGQASLGPTTKYPSNANGQTYGSAGGYSPYLPDLIAVTGTGTDGQPLGGYVFQTDIQQPTPTSPTEALKMQDEWNAKYPHGKTVKMYASDGKTVIGTWVEGQP